MGKTCVHKILGSPSPTPWGGSQMLGNFGSQSPHLAGRGAVWVLPEDYCKKRAMQFSTRKCSCQEFGKPMPKILANFWPSRICTRSWKEKKQHEITRARFCTQIHAQYDWTTGAPDNGNEWRKKFPRRTSLVPLAFPCFVLCLVGMKTEGLFRLPGGLLPLFGGTFTQSYSVSNRVAQKLVNSWSIPRQLFHPIGNCRGLPCSHPLATPSQCGETLEVSTAKILKSSPFAQARKENPNLNFLSPDIFLVGWGSSTWRGGGPKKFGMSLETQGIKLFLAGYPGIFAGISREAPRKSLRKKMFGFNSRPLFATFPWGVKTWTSESFRGFSMIF